MPTFRTTDDVTLAYTDQGEGRPVVLVHGYTAPAASWVLTVDALLDAGYRAIAFDRRAHGESETPAYGQRMARHGRDLGELLAHLDLEGAVVVGASMGGNTLWAYVDQFGPARLPGRSSSTRPRRCSTTTGGSTVSTATSRPTPAPSSRRACPTPAAAAPSTDPAAAVLRLVERLGARRRSATPRPRRPCLSSPTTPCRTGATSCGDSPCPLLMLAGRESQIWPCEHAEAAVAGTLRGRALVIEDAGHAISFDQPDRFNEVLLEFLADVDAETAQPRLLGHEAAGTR